jgi:hypothetical protein
MAAEPCGEGCFISPAVIIIAYGMLGTIGGLALGPPVGAWIGAKQDYVFGPRPREAEEAMPAKSPAKPEVSASDSTGE